MTDTQTIQNVAQEMLDNLEWKKRTDGKEYVCQKVMVQWQQDIYHKAHGDRLPDDYTYEFISEALSAIADSTEGNEDEAIQEIEAYTSNLTEWLHSHNGNVYYMDQAVNDLGATDGFQILASAQYLAKQEVAQVVLQGIRDYIGE